MESLLKMLKTVPPTIPVIRAEITLNKARGNPKKPYVTKIESIPVWGVEVKKEIVAPLDAPLFNNDIPVGRTPHEQRGKGTPNIEAKKLALKELSPRWRFINLSLKNNLKKPAKVNPSNK